MINGIHYITLASDASGGRGVEGHDGVGFAYYYRTDDGTKRHAWYMPVKIGISKAELIACVEGMKAIKAAGHQGKLIIYMDNQIVLTIMKRQMKAVTIRKYKGLVEECEQLLRYFDDVEFRHVKSHQKRSDQKRWYLNRWCDINARTQLRSKGNKPIREVVPT